METGIINYLNEQFGISVNPGISTDQLEGILAERINHLVINDFPQLLQLLYRIDISEQKLKALISNNPETDAGRIIARMIIERQLEKARLRERFKRDEGEISEEDKW